MRHQYGFAYECATYPLKIHTLHSPIHPFHDLTHTIRNSPHRHSRLDSTRDSIDPGCETEEIEPFGLFSNGILGVDPGAFGIAFL